MGEGYVIGDALVEFEDEVGEGGSGEEEFLVIGNFAESAVAD